MPISDHDKQTMQEIVELEGVCLDSKRCQRCPFRATCLPEFLNPTPPSQLQRHKMASDILTHHFLIDDEITIEDVQKEYKWDKR